MKANRKKGISPLLAAVLLIAFTVALATIVFGFMNTVFRSTTVTVGNRTTEAVGCSAAAIAIQQVYVSTIGNGTVYAIVKNAGIVDNLVIQDAAVINSTGVNFTSRSVPISDFDKGEIVRLEFVGTGMISAACPGAFSKVIVTTSCPGISDSFDSTPICSS